MDGTLAVIFILAGVTDMTINDCPTGCLERSDAQTRMSFQAGEVIFQENGIGEEVYIGYDRDVRYGPLQPTFGASATSDGDLWVGAGAKWTSRNHFDGPFFLETSLMPGLYAHGNGPDISGPLQFRSAAGIGVEFSTGATLTLLYDHRSNADTQLPNPGLETLSLRYAIALN